MKNITEKEAKKILLSIKEDGKNVTKKEILAINLAVEALDFVQECKNKCMESIMRSSEVVLMDNITDAEWLDYDMNGTYCCSECTHLTRVKSDICPNCKCRMK